MQKEIDYDSRRSSLNAQGVQNKYESFDKSTSKNKTDSKLNNLAKSGSETLKLSMGKHAKKLYNLRDMEATKDMDKILDRHQTLTSRAMSIDKANLPKNHVDAPDFLRVLDDPKYKNV